MSGTNKKRRYNRFLEPDYDRREVSYKTHKRWKNYSVQAATESDINGKQFSNCHPHNT